MYEKLLSFDLLNLAIYDNQEEITLPTKIMIDPRSIWNDEAEVNVNAIYIIDVAHTSQRAGK